ncbi:hypothetical protein EAF04_003742 [Stromatinia cepivora]|nr:hypothetical protein EAF04_003742 [Stromatinia cepivora]
MDNGPREKEMANSIKQIVKHTSRRKGQLAGLDRGQNNGGNREASTINLAPKPVSLFSKESPTVIEDGGHKKASSESSPAQSAQSTSADTSMALIPDSGNILLGTQLVAGGEAALLMHVLDNVFPLQYPMYKPEVAKGERGWLLSLLLKTKPLYHASIGLSAYQRCVNAIRSTQHSVDCNSILPESGLGIMACVVQLVFFELFGVRKSSWQIHLRAATDLLGQRYRKHDTELGFMINDESTSNTLRAAQELTGKPPQLLDLHPVALGARPQIKLEKVMGCKNWVMREIGRIAILHESQRHGLQNGTFDAYSFKTQADDIRQTIRRGLNEQFLSELRITNPKSNSHANSPISPHEIITQIFTRAAHLYLELVVGGFKGVEENPDFHNIIAEPTMMLPTLPRGDLFRAIVCPLYIFGCVAKAEDRNIFRNIFSSLPLNDPFVHHRSTILPLLEKIWSLRDTHSNNVSWESVFQLSEDKIVLL